MFFKFSAIAALVASAAAHMAVTEPCVRYTSQNSKCPSLPAGAAFDYNIKNPLGYDEALCKHTTPFDTPVETWTAGQAVTVKFQTDGAAHGGGHCQFSLSYDGGKTFVVVHEELQYCFFGKASSSNTAAITQYTFNLPSNLPSSDKAVFAWTWVNAIGNREFYMNCADVAIKGSSTSFTGKQMTIANHNGYPTIPEFNGDYNTGLEHYKNAAQITVAGSGSSSSGGKGDSQSVYVSSSVGGPIGHGPQTASSTVAVVPSPVYSPSPAPVYSSVAPVPKPSVVATPAPQPTSVASTSCTHGAMQCNGSGYKVCVWGTWSKDINCPARTACKQTSASAVICDWA